MLSRALCSSKRGALFPFFLQLSEGSLASFPAETIEEAQSRATESKN